MPSGIVLDLRNLADLHDDSRNHHTITNHNAIPVRGIHGRGMDFNGTTAYLDCGNHSSLNITDAITIEAWVKPADTSANIDFLLSKHASAWGYDTPWALSLHSTGDIQMKTGDGANLQTYNRQSYDVGEWQHLVGIADGTNLYIYKNGALLGSTPQTVIPYTNNANLEIGIGFGVFPFNGTTDNVIIYNYALDVDTIKLQYRQQSPYYQEEAPTICL